jgi:hypothetical protein
MTSKKRKDWSLDGIQRRFKLSDNCVHQIEKLLVFMGIMGSCAGFVIGLMIPSAIFNMFNWANSNTFDPWSMFLGVFIGIGFGLWQHYYAHHRAPCCKRHNATCRYQK